MSHNTDESFPLAESLAAAMESDYLETEEHLFFAVKGLVHPNDRIFAYLRYAPDPDGNRQKEGRPYRRLYHFAEQEQLLKASYPHYLAYDPYYQMVLQGVPWRSVRRVYSSRRHLQELFQQTACDPLEKDVLAFATILQQAAGISRDCLGVSGSTLIGLHTPGSDIDMTVHGEQNCWALRRALLALLMQPFGEVRRLDQAGMRALYSERSADTRMEYSDFLRSEERKVIQGFFRGRTYFIRFLKEKEEFGETYGDRYYTPVGRGKIQAVVTDDREAIFTPCRYPLAEVHLLSGPTDVDIIEAVSFRGRFCEQAEIGDMVQASGTIERVEERSGRVWHRLILGSETEDTMFVIR